MTDPTSPDRGDTDTDDRRRVLELALDRRPDMSIADLHDALAAVGLDAGTDVLVADLDALGFEVDPGDVPAVVPVAPTPAAPVGLAKAERADDGPSFAPRPTASAGTIGAAPGVGDDGAPPWWQGRTGVVALAAVVLVIALVVAFVVAGGDDEDEAADGGDRTTQAGSGAPSAGATTAPATPVGPAGPTPTAPTGPGEDQELLAGVDGSSAFDDSVDDGLGTAPDGSEWDIAAGSWSVGDGLARLDGVEGETGVGLATFDPQLPAYRLQVRMASLVGGNGLVFGAAGPDDYYTFVAAPELSTFVLAHVVGGEAEIIDNSNLTATVDGRAVIGVHVTAGAVEALVNGAVVLTAPLESGLPGTAMGLGSAPGSSGGTFDEVSYRADP